MTFFPDREKRDDIKFIFAKSLSYNKRISIIVILMLLALFIQLFVNFWIGLIVITAGNSLSLISGYSPKYKMRSGTEEWAQVTPDEYKKIKLKQGNIKKWDIDIFDVTNPGGLFLFLALIIPCIVITVLLINPKLSYIINKKYYLLLYILMNTLFILIPHWITGTRNYLKKDMLMIKIELLEKIMEMLSSPSDVQILPMLSTKETTENKRVPEDARLMIRLLNAPDYFMGIQVQISINSVQGTYYPYLYCVILSKQKENLFKKNKGIIDSALTREKIKKTGIFSTMKGSMQLIDEISISGDVDVLVIRQKTTKNYGYHTNTLASQRIVNASLDLARSITKQTTISEEI